MLMKKIIIWAIGIISITLILYMIIVNPFSDEYKVKNKFKEIGYSDNEISEIMKVIPEEDYNIILKRNYNDSLIDIITASGFKEEKLNEYCTWLFDILFELEKLVDVSKYDSFHARFFGRISELLLDVWINTNKLSYKEIKVIDIENVNWIKKGKAFLSAKFTGKRYEKSF